MSGRDGTKGKDKKKKNQEINYKYNKNALEDNKGRTDINWYPGHMAKTKRKITESLKLVDLVAEIVDARIPLSSRNPDLEGLIRKSSQENAKPHVILLNKMDMASEKATQDFIKYFAGKGIPALALDSKNGRNLNRVIPLFKETLKDDIARWQERGMVGRAIRVMVAGIPNSGKSSFINKMAGGTKARVEDRPGVTRDNQWYVMEDGTQMLDTPGVLWPKFESEEVAKKLAFTGAIKDKILDIEEIACSLISILVRDYPDSLKDRYRLTDKDFEEAERLADDAMLINSNIAAAFEVLKRIGVLRGMLVSGGEVDTERVAIALLDEFRAGKIGRITLERPN